MLGTSDPYSIPKSNPFTKESGVSNLLDDTHWAVNEFVEAELGDERRTERLVVLAGVLAQYPTAALPEACSDRAMLKAAYRFIGCCQLFESFCGKRCGRRHLILGLWRYGGRWPLLTHKIPDTIDGRVAFPSLNRSQLLEQCFRG
jgi:hypothetical protein